MPKIETVLRSGTPASPSFTLHDNEHSFRVAETTIRLVGGDTERLSNIEMAMLLLAAYCHDIGMSPERDRVRSHSSYLITGDPGTLSATDQINLQAWLDVNREGLTPPIEPTRISYSGLIEVEEITAYYTRSRHNDWSEEWIRENLASDEHPLYHRWLEDLVTLCKSHHEGISQLRSQRFNARQVGSPSQPLNLRYLACLLRLADVLEFAPERTPSVILSQRSINPSSRIFWHKDHSISFNLDPDSGIPSLSARTSDAAIHHAVLETADWVDNELAICSSLNQEGAFQVGNLLGDQRQAYSWRWSGKLHRDIKEADNSFVYIDGAFRPDSMRVLQLLSGTALYSKPIVALRELIQNSLDAIQEQIAYERLQQADPLDSKLLTGLSQIHHIRIVLTKEQDRYWLRCIDDGTGMTRGQIEKSLLVSGSGVRGDLRQLERRARQSGFSIGRTGKFGVGVLSYFMLADKLIINTRRSQESNDIDGCGWTFEIDGLGSFGELRKLGRAARGTEMALRLQPQIVEEGASRWFKEATDFLLDQVRYSPCSIEFQDHVSGVASVCTGPGWTHDQTAANEPLITATFKTEPRSSDLRTTQEEEEEQREREGRERLVQAALESLHWFGEGDHIFSEPSALVRLRLPYWELPGGPCSAFLDISQNRELASSFVVEAHHRNPPRIDAWQGIKVGHDGRSTTRASVEVNFVSDRLVSVDRFRFIDKSAETGAKIRASAKSLWTDWLKSSHDSLYNEFNVMHAPLTFKERARLLSEVPAWPVLNHDGNIVWQRVKDGIVSFGRLSFYNSTEIFFQYNGQHIDEAAHIKLSRKLMLHDLYSGGKIVAFDVGGYSGGMVGLRWDRASEMVRYDGTLATSTSEFPQNWSDTLVIFNPGRAFYNRDHPVLTKMMAAPIQPPLPPELTVEDRLELGRIDIGRATQFLMYHINRKPEFWLALAQKHRPAFSEIMRHLGVTGSNQLKILSATALFQDEGFIDIGAVLTGEDVSGKRHPATPPASEWLLTEVDMRKKR